MSNKIKRMAENYAIRYPVSGIRLRKPNTQYRIALEPPNAHQAIAHPHHPRFITEQIVATHTAP